MGVRSVLPALGLAAAASVYLWVLLNIRAAYQTSYNDYFAIPVTALVIVGALTEIGRRYRRRDGPDAGIREGTRSPLRNPRIRIAVLLAVFLAGLGRLPFIPWTTAVLVAAVLALQPDTPQAKRLPGPVFLSIVTAGALGLSAVLYLAFGQLGARL